MQQPVAVSLSFQLFNDSLMPAPLFRVWKRNGGDEEEEQRERKNKKDSLGLNLMLD